MRQVRQIGRMAVAGSVLLAAGVAVAQETVTASATQTVVAGGTIRGTVKAGVVPLPGVAVTATNTLTGKRYATTTDVDGAFAMAIPQNGRYVLRAELTAFAPATAEVRLTAEAHEQTAALTMELASRAAAEAAAQSSTTTSALATALGRGVQSLSVSGAGEGTLDASAGGGGNTGTSLPSLAGMGADTAGAGTDSVAVSGQQGQTNGLANFNEDEIRQRVQDAMEQARRQGGANGDQVNAAVSMLGGMMGGPGGGFGGGFGGPGGGGRGGGGRGGGFRGFNPTQPHGAVFYQGGFSALNAQTFSLTGTPNVKPSSYQNRFGVSFTGSPYIPGLFKPSTKQFVFLNVTGQRNITPQNLYGTVPTALERTGDFSQSVTTANGGQVPVTIYDPATGQPYANDRIAGGTTGLSPQALALLQYYPLPNVPNVTTRNYQTITTAGSNTTNGSARYVRNFGAAGFGPGGGFGGGGRGGGGANAVKALRQNVNAAFSFSHAASDLRNIIPVLGGKTSSDGYALSTGYVASYGRITNNASLNWNRSHAETVNFFTGSAVSPAVQAGVYVPSQAAGLAQQGFYNGVPNISVTNYTSLMEQQPKDAVNQTISFSDFLSWRHAKHNFRFGTDVRRVHADQVGGNNVTGSFTFSGLVTQSTSDRNLTLVNSSSSTKQATTGSALADFLIGQPQQTKIQAGLYKTYLRANVFDAYAQDDYRVASNVTLNYGLRYEYFSPYVEKNNRLVNLDHNADFTVVDPVQPDGSGTYLGAYPRSLVNPDRVMFAPRGGVAWRPTFLKETVVRAGYGLNYNTGQFATFAQSLAFQPPFATTQNNVLATLTNNTGCYITAPGSTAYTLPMTNMTLASGFACSNKAVQNTYAVNKNYRLGHVQVYNLDLQRTLPHGVVVNVGYNGSKGGNLDIVRAPNATATTVTTADAQAFTYEDSVAESRNNQLTVSARKRMEKGIALQAVYQYGHSIDNASSIGGSTVSTVQNDQRLDLEESNSSFDVRQKLTGNFVFELPFGPNRAFLNKGGWAGKVLDGFEVSGDFTFATGTYYTPQYQNTAAELAAGGTYTLRPDRVFSQPIAGSGTSRVWFNKAAFAAPANGFGTASRNSIEGPGTVSVDMSAGRTVELGGSRSLEFRAIASNVFNTVQYSGIDTVFSSATFGQVTSTAAQRTISVLGRYRF